MIKNMINNINCFTVTITLCILSVPIAGLVISWLPLGCVNPRPTFVDFCALFEIFCIIDIITCIIIVPVNVTLTMHFIEKEKIMLSTKLIIMAAIHFLLVLCNLSCFVILIPSILENLECIHTNNILSLMLTIYCFFKIFSIIYSFKQSFRICDIFCQK